MKLAPTLAALALTLASSAASATVLTSRLHVDDSFVAYISTTADSAGTAFSSGNVWSEAVTGSVELLQGQDYYLHIVANNASAMAGVLGEFELFDSTHAFANGAQWLLTNTEDWVGNNTGFGDTNIELGDYGFNGSDPWQYRDGTATDAKWIWPGANEWTDVAYLSTKITAFDLPSEVPEPASLALLGLGLAGLGAATRRRRHG